MKLILNIYRRGVVFVVFLLGALCVSGQTKQPWLAGKVITRNDATILEKTICFRSEYIPDEVFQRMRGKSFKANNYIKRSELRYLKLLHYDNNGRILTGEMVCNKLIANDLVEIFHELYRVHYPIERMVLIDDYGADDEQSMRANNTSCFCYRNMGGRSKLSKHSLGMAVDVNPLYNPHYRRYKSGKVVVSPATAAKYVSRRGKFPYKIVRGDLLYKLFVGHGFRWGGAWLHSKDYQHFEK